jgi:DNA mismatch repair protein MutS
MGEKLTPMMQQYRTVKEKYSDCIVLFRLGDFYEMFFEDAVEASKILNITLTSRNKGNGVKAPMCGVPFHAADKYMGKLTRAGKKVAICDQVTAPDGTGIVEREVVRVVTPGTTQDDNLLEGKANNYVACLVQSFDAYGFAYADVTTGEAFVSEFLTLAEIKQEIARVSPAEIIMPQTLIDNDKIRSLLNNFKSVAYFPFEIYGEPEKVLIDSFGMKCISVFGLEDKKGATHAAATLYEYLKETQKTELKHLEGFNFYQVSDYIALNDSTIRNLDIFYSSKEMKKEGSLFWVLDKVKTAMGGRTLRKWMIHPLKNEKEIEERLEAVSELRENATLLGDLREVLGRISDIERLLSRLSMGTGSARDLVGLNESLRVIPELKSMLGKAGADFLKEVADDLVDMTKLVEFVGASVKEEPPSTVREGGMIADGYNQELDELRAINTEGKGYIADMQKREIERTGISSLKIKYNKVFGYYIEISNSNLDSAPEDYIRKQTLVNAERFITPELKEYEEKVLNSIDRIRELEYELFHGIRMKVVERIVDIKKIAAAVGRLDTIGNFAEVALRGGYCRPEIVSDAEDISSAGILEIRDGRHPILEQLSLARDFVPNDCVMGGDGSFFNLITGPNMGGKSVYIKQVALIVYLAHIGCFVPAESCRLGLVDQIFTRVGASDDLAAGESTFMVEMVEASTILHNATSRSLIILDEIGRGTSTYDGVSIAWAICEYLHDHIGAKTLFATHYHELVDLIARMEKARNFSVAVSERAAKHEDGNSDLVFLYKIVEGGTSKSYGIEVAKLAGLPKEVVMRARGVLDKLEKEVVNGEPKVNRNQVDMFTAAESTTGGADAKTESREHKALEELKKVDPNNLTPLEALKKLHDLKEKGII